MKMHKNAGFTMMELMVVLAIVGVLGFVALLSFNKQIKENRLTSVANQLHTVYKFARSEAVKRDIPINLELDNGKWLVKIDPLTLIQVFEETQSDISIPALASMTLSSTGSTSEEKFLITDNTAGTDDYCLSIYVSGQSTLTKGGSCS